MEPKEFQRDALERFAEYLGELRTADEAAARTYALIAANPDADIALPDPGKKAYEAMRSQGKTGRDTDYSPRKDGCGRPVPNVTLKVPTGGGKTFLAVQAIGRIRELFLPQDSHHFVLWIVPSREIYRQTLEALKNHESPLRKTLNQVSRNRVRILEKESPLNRHDLEGTLTVMLLMLQSANRSDAETLLRLFRDRGNVNGFFPNEADRPAHDALRREVPNLEVHTLASILGDASLGEQSSGLIKSSMGNALRLLRPIVVLDEGHKGISELSHQTLMGFNPRFMLELTATPKDTEHRRANWLVDIRGTELHREEMIKMPIQLAVTGDGDWRHCVRVAWEKTVALQASADQLRADKNRYVRPILLVQAEVTGPKQVNSGHIHAYHVRDYLNSLGVPPEAVVLKTADQDDLNGAPPRALLDPRSPVRVIITKEALKEGWDCAFAYVLCSLTASRSATSITQMVGRVLRQPDARRTGVEALDQCYVFTPTERTGDMVKAVRNALEGEGMGDLVHMVQRAGQASTQVVRIERRSELQRKPFYLPKVLWVPESGVPRELDWEADILGGVDWASLRLTIGPAGLARGTHRAAITTAAVGLDVLEGGAPTSVTSVSKAAPFDRVRAARILQEKVPNPFLAGRWVEYFLAEAATLGWTEDDLAHEQGYVVSVMLRRAGDVVEAACQAVFERELEAGRVIFDLVAELSWPVPVLEEFSVSAGSQMLFGHDGGPLKKSLFDPVYREDLNTLELEVAQFVDAQEAVWWWYRNVVKGDAYALQGWRRHRMYPDFVIAQRQGDGVARYVVLETKGDHLGGSLDTKYKAALAERLVGAYGQSRGRAVGQFTLFETPAKYTCDIVLGEEWKPRVRGLLETIPGPNAAEA